MHLPTYLEGLLSELDNANRAGRKEHAKLVEAEIARVRSLIEPGVETADASNPGVETR